MNDQKRIVASAWLASLACILICGCSDTPSQTTAQEDVSAAARGDSAARSVANDGSELPQAKGPCFLGVPTRCLADGKFEVLVDGKLAGTFRDRGAGEAMNARRVIFQGGGQVTITFRIYRQDMLAYQPTFTMVVEPGTMLASNWRFADEEPVPDFGPRPDRSFAALVPDVPKRVWCWFGPSPIHKDVVSIELEDETRSPIVRKLLSDAGYEMVQENRYNAGKTISWKLRIPGDKTIVEAILELEGVKGVKSVYAEVTHVY
jgi:hypothetical protein